jgi:signal transduction histidine kinase
MPETISGAAWRVVGRAADRGSARERARVLLADEGAIVRREDDGAARARHHCSVAATPRSVASRVAALPPRRLDALIALFFLVEGWLEVLLWTTLEGSRTLAGLGIVTLLAAGVYLRRIAPLAAIALAAGTLVLNNLLGPDVTDHTAGPIFAILLVTFTAGTRLEGRRLVAGFLLGAAMLAGSYVGLSEDDSVPNVIFSVTFFAGAPMLLGQLLVNRARLNRALGDKARRAEAERRERAESAALEERTRIAGELHDVVAHALSAMTVQASAARRLSDRDPVLARDAFATVEHTGREALSELRRLLGVLRKEDEELALAPQPSLAHVDALARRAEAAGLPVRLVVSGSVRALPAGIDLTAYRLVQEALGSARDAGHAGRAEVRIEYGDEDVRVDVADDGATRGRRLLGMRERVAVYGGELATAPEAGGGWRVSARLPLGATAS